LRREAALSCVRKLEMELDWLLTRRFEHKWLKTLASQ
jgi:hypothetical protein